MDPTDKSIPNNGTNFEFVEYVWAEKFQLFYYVLVSEWIMCKETDVREGLNSVTRVMGVISVNYT